MGLGPPPRGVIELVLANLAAKCIAMNPKNFCSSALIPIRAFQHSLDEFFLKFRDGLFEQNTALYHQPHKRFQLIFHLARSEGDAPQVPVRLAHDSLGWKWPAHSVHELRESMMLRTITVVRGP
jgi:hypothetical protein